MSVYQQMCLTGQKSHGGKDRKKEFKGVGL